MERGLFMIFILLMSNLCNRSNNNMIRGVVAGVGRVGYGVANVGRKEVRYCF